MSLLKKTNFRPDEIPIYDNAIIYKRGGYWQFRMWLAQEHKYARFSLRTKTQSTATDKAKQHYHELMSQQLQGKTYFSKTTKQGVEIYLEQRKKDVDAGIIVEGRYGTIKTHLEHWLDFIKRDTKLKELERTDCENYYAQRTATKKKIQISQTTVLNEQSTINAMMSWLYKCKETHIEAFDFKKLKRVDRGDDGIRRASFTDDEIENVKTALERYVLGAKKDISDPKNLERAIVGSYLYASIISGLRRGEQLQLRWQDIRFDPFTVRTKSSVSNDLVEIKVRAATSKVRRSRTLIVKDDQERFDDLFHLLKSRFEKAKKASGSKDKFADALIFSADGYKPITARAIEYHFKRIIVLANVPNTHKRKLVPYSFRHYFITQKVNSGLAPVAVAEMCGTSATQIESTYYHTTKEKMIANALAGYEYRDGLLIPK